MSHFKLNPKFSKLNEKYNLVSTLYGGTDAMREAGTEYLPREPAEAIANYNTRLGRSVLYPAYQRTIKTSVGKAFAKPMQIKTLDQLMPLLDNADAAGTSLETFSKELMEDAINYGITYLLVDYPVIDANATLADERLMGAFPYLVNVKPTQVCEIHVGYVEGVAQLIYFRFIENVSEYNGTEQVSVEQAKEFVLVDGVVTYTIYRKDKSDKEFVYDSNIISGIDLIPIIPVYGNKESTFHGSPTLYDLAQLNVAHWQTFSDYRNIVHAVSCPILVIKGIQDEVDPATGEVKDIVISPNSAVRVPEQGDVKWVEINGESIKAAKEALADLEEKMAVMGLELTIPKATGTETATGRLLDAAESNSILKSIAIDLEWSIYAAFCYAGRYLGLDATKTEVQIDTQYTVALGGDMTTIMSMYTAGLLTAKEVIHEAKSRQLLSDATVGIEPSKEAK